MSLFAGVFLRSPDTPFPRGSRAAVRESIARDGDHVETYQDDRLFLAKYDFGAFGAPAFVTDPPVAALTGEPFLTNGSSGDRSDDVERLRTRVSEGDRRDLQQCRGTFSLCLYSPRGNPSIKLVSDRLGIRPIYYCCQPDVLYFASSFRVIDSIPGMPKTLDPRGMIEDTFHGYALGARTPYAEVKRIRGGMVVRVDSTTLRRHEYSQWSEAARLEQDRERFLRSLYDVFVDAVSIRSAREESALSFLSGGLDSRAVVGALTAVGKEVFTLSYREPGELDGIIARKVAERLGTHHTERRRQGTRQQLLKAGAPDDFNFGPKDRPRFDRFVFSGDGGSVGLGFSSRMDEERVRLLRDQRLRDVIENMGVYESVPARSLFPRDRYQRFQDVIAAGVREEVRREPSDDPARDFHRFLMENDQRRHLDYLFEDMDRHQCEFLLPFFDGRFLEMVAGAPVDWFLRHKLYNDWIQLFPSEITSVAWQVYPGHVPCPVEPDDEIASARTQWEASRNLRQVPRFREAYREARKQFLEDPSANGLLSPVRIGAALLLHGLRAREYSRLWPKVTKFQELAAKSGGRLAY